MKIIVIGDIHNKVDWVEPFLLGQTYDKVIFLGDYLDDFGDNANDAFKTARWMKRMLDDDRNVLCMGNHDLAYAIPNNVTNCPGWDEYKNQAVNSILKRKDWDKVKIVHFEEPDMMFSHAGALNIHFNHPVLGVTKEGIIKKCDEALERIRGGLYDGTICHWGTRGGATRACGGILWADWCELCADGLIKGWTQVVGHTPRHEPRIYKVDKKHVNICLDTHTAFYMTITDGVSDIHKNPYFKFKKPNYKGTQVVSGMTSSDYGIKT